MAAPFGTTASAFAVVEVVPAWHTQESYLSTKWCRTDTYSSVLPSLQRPRASLVVRPAIAGGVRQGGRHASGGRPASGGPGGGRVLDPTGTTLGVAPATAASLEMARPQAQGDENYEHGEAAGDELEVHVPIPPTGPRGRKEIRPRSAYLRAHGSHQEPLAERCARLLPAPPQEAAGSQWVAASSRDDWAAVRKALHRAVGPSPYKQPHSVPSLGKGRLPEPLASLTRKTTVTEEEYEEAIVPGIQSRQALDSPYLGSVFHREDQLESVLRLGGSTLQCLRLGDHTWLSAEFLAALGPCAPRVREVNLQGTRANDAVIVSLADHCPDICILDVSNTDVTDLGCVAAAFCDLQEFRAVRCRRAVTSSFVGSLRSLKKLEVLDISFCTDVQDQGLIGFSQSGRTLTWLSLAGCTGVGSEGVLAVARANPGLLHLSVAHNAGAPPRCFGVG